MEAIPEFPGSEPATPTPSSYDDDKVSRLTLVENMEDDVEEDVDVPPMIGAITLNRKRKSRAIKAFIRRRQLSEDGKGSVVDRDLITALRQLAVSGGGLVRDEHRQVVWPLLGESLEDSHSTGSPSSSSSDERASSESDYESAKSSVADDNDPGTPLIELGEPTVEDLKTHCEWRQVEMDVYRTLTRFPPNISDGHRSILQDELTPLIVRVLWDNPNYRYYQGFHDVCLTMLLVLGRPAALRMSTQLAASASFRRYLTEPLEQSAIKDIELVYVILANTDTDLEYYMRRAELGQLFALSWLLTWFAHSIDKYDSVVRLYDFFLASHSLMPVYLSAALVLYRSSEILDKCECDMAQIHSLLSKLPRQMPLEALIADAQDLYLQFPPSRLRGDLLRAYEEQVVLDRRLDRQKPSALLRMGGRRPPPGVNRHAFQMIFWAGTASAAAWYFLSNYGVREMSWMQFT